MTQESSPSSVAIILGGGRRATGELTQLSLDRLDAGIELYRRRDVVALVVMGGFYSTWSPRAICFNKTAAELRRSYLIQRGVEPRDIVVLDDEARDTIYEAFVARRHFRKTPADRASLVTSEQHLRRALFIFRRVLADSPPVLPVPVSSNGLLHDDEEEAYYRATAELFARMPDELPDPGTWEDWYSNNEELYRRFAEIRVEFAPKDGVENQAYGAVESKYDPAP